MTKADYIKVLKEKGFTEYYQTPLEQLSIPELEALWKDTEPQTARDPMTGLSSLHRAEINHVCDMLMQTSGESEKMKNQGLVLLAIRKKLAEMTHETITIGKRVKGLKFPALLEQSTAMEQYRHWLLEEVSEQSHPQLKKMAAYVALHMNKVKTILPAKQTPHTYMKMEPDFPSEPKLETRSESFKVEGCQTPKMPINVSRASSSKVPIQAAAVPQWDGTQNFEEYRQEVDRWVKATAEHGMSEAAKRPVPTEDDL